MSNGLRSLRNSNIFVHPVDLSEFYIIINLFADRWFDTSHKWTLAWLDSFLQSLVLTTAIRKVAAHPFHVPWAIHQRFSLFASEFVQSQDHWTIQSKSYHFCGTSFLWNPFWHIHWAPVWVFGSSNIVCKYIYDHFSDRWCPDASKMISFHEKSGGATSSC